MLLAASLGILGQQKIQEVFNNPVPVRLAYVASHIGENENHSKAPPARHLQSQTPHRWGSARRSETPFHPVRWVGWDQLAVDLIFSWRWLESESGPHVLHQKERETRVSAIDWEGVDWAGEDAHKPLMVWKLSDTSGRSSWGAWRYLALPGTFHK